MTRKAGGAARGESGRLGSFGLGALALVAAIGSAYAGVYDAPFALDDRTDILETKDTPLGDLLWTEPTRALVKLTFFMSRRAFGESLAAYHAGNVAIHACTALLLLAWLRSLRRLRAPGLPAWAPFLGALLWALHPIQTGAVTYLAQRTALLAALCYLGASLCYLRAREARCGGASVASGTSLAWFLGAIGFATLGVVSKENSATLPVALLLLEALVVGGRAPDSKRVRALLLAPFLLALPGFYAAYLLHAMARAGAAAAGHAPGGAAKVLGYVAAYQGIDFPTPKEYLLTQAGVLLRYLRLWLLPVNQVFDPLILPVRRVADLGFLLPAGCLASLALAALTQVRRRPLVAFGVLWFFVTISVESSVIPISDFYFEHRMLLPSAGLVVAILGLAESVLASHPRRGLAVAAVLALALGVGTIARNRVWDDSIGFWLDDVRKAPGKLRGWLNLSDAYTRKDRFDLAEEALSHAEAIYERSPEVHYNLGVVRLRRGKTGAAETSLRRAIKLYPLHPEAHYNLGTILAQTGRPLEAEAEFRWVLRIAEVYVPEAHYNLGVLYRAQGRLNDALREIETAVRGRPALLEAHHNLAVLYRRLGREADAAREAAIAERLRREKGAP